MVDPDSLFYLSATALEMLWIGTLTSESDHLVGVPVSGGRLPVIGWQWVQSCSGPAD